jgi:hypothetical protein
LQAQAQDRPSLQETINWVSSKFQAYFAGIERPDERALDKDYKLDRQGYTMEFDRGTLYLSYSYQNGIARYFAYNGRFVVAIPLQDIEGYKNGTIKTKIASIKLHTWGTSSWQRNSSEGSDPFDYTSYTDNVHLGFEVSREENLEERLEKAFENLKYYYPKPKSNEAF